MTQALSYCTLPVMICVIDMKKWCGLVHPVAIPPRRIIVHTAIAHVMQSRLRESAQGDKWSFCLTAGKISPRIRREHEQETAPEPCIGLQGKGGARSDQGRPHAGAAGRAV